MAGEGDEYWERMLRAAPYHGSVEKLRDAADVRGWHPPRSVPAGAGVDRGRAHRQVNVKLSRVDFELLCSLAVGTDVAPSTMARMLLRRALVKAATEELT